MPKRGRKKKFKLNLNVRSETTRSIGAILLIVAALITFISLIFQGYTVNEKLQEVLGLGFGYARILLIPIFLLGGLLLAGFSKWRFVELRILIGLLVMLFSSAGLIHAFYLKDGMEVARAGGGGGLIGYYIAHLLSSMLSIYGAFVLLAGILVLSALLVSDKSLTEILEVVAKVFEKAPLGKLPLGFLQRNKPDGATSDDIEITSGLNLDAPEPELNLLPQEPSFEIIPTISEPQSEKGANPEQGMSISPAAPTLPYSDRVWELPPLDLLNEPPNTPVDRGDVKQRIKIIEDTLESFGIVAKVKDIRYGPSVTQYALEAESGTKIAKIVNLQYDLALALASPTGSVRIEAPIPGKSLVGIEVPNNNRVTVHFKDLLTSEPMKSLKSKVGIALGLDVGGQPLVYDIGRMPHLLIAGATGSGKSIFIHSLMASILFRASPQEVKFLLIDPKRVELVHYNGIPHLLSPVITDMDKAPSAFKWLVEEMRKRYKLLEAAKVRNIQAYNEKSGFQAMPYIVLVVDELAEIMMIDPAAVEKSIVSLAQLARATGIHLVLALQRPSTNIITGLIKANVPCRIALNVTSQVDSRVIIDQPGAEKLLGNGDMLFIPPDISKPIRIQGTFISDKEIANLVNFLKSQGVEPSFTEEMFDMRDEAKSISAGGDGVDDYFDEATEIVVAEGKGSASLLQRRLSIGYSRAARILDELEARGIVGPAKGSKPRDVLMKRREYEGSSYSENFEDDFN